MVSFVEQHILHYSTKRGWIIVDSSKITEEPGKYLFQNNFQLVQLR